MNKHIQQAITIFNQGGIVIFPTDTAFGIGCRLDKPETIDRLFSIRKRPLTQATPVLVSSKDMAFRYYHSPPDIVRRLMDAYWPGALTIIAPCDEENIYSPVRGNGKTIGIRMPNHSDILAVITALGVPILGPSANFHGEATPYTQTDLNPELIKLVDYIMSGTCNVGFASTVIDCSVEPPVIIRQGAINVKI